MSASAYSFDESQALAYLVRFLGVQGITGEEEAISKEVRAALREAGVPAGAIQSDGAEKRIPLPCQTGNLVVKLPGTRLGLRRLFMTHLDTVALCAGAKPVLKGKRLVPAGDTALGGDNRTGVACLVTLVATLLQRKLPHPPLTLLFTVREESGLWGARYVDLDALGKPVEGYNVDGGTAAGITVGAVGADRWEVEVEGKASHAGVYPERGISATMVAALALAEAQRGGWFGKVRRDGRDGTSNVGPFGGRDGTRAGSATNVVTDFVRVEGESRSNDSRLIGEITAAYKQAFRDAAGRLPDDQGKTAKIRFKSRRDYFPFRLADNAPVVRNAAAAAQEAGLTPVLRETKGGLDANWLTRHGIPTITFGAGQNNPHTVQEFVELKEFMNGCRLALALATAKGG